MRVAIVGGGLVGLALARILGRRGISATVLERLPADVYGPRPFVLSYHGFDALEAAGVGGRVRGLGWEIAPGGGADGGPVGLAVDFVEVCRALADGVPVGNERTVSGVIVEGDRVAGLRVSGPDGEETHETDLVVACDGVRSPVREMAGIAAELTPAEGGHLSFMSAQVVDRSFAMAYQSDGRQVGMLGWPTGSAGWWDIERLGRGAALAPGLDAFKRSYARLLPAAAPALDGLTSIDQIVYREVTEVRCPTWWRPGVAVIGDAAHFLGPEAGIGAGLGLGDALAMAVAIERNRRDPDRACADYETWRRPATAPYEALGAAGGRMIPAGAGSGIGGRPEAERWPPVD